MLENRDGLVVLTIPWSVVTWFWLMLSRRQLSGVAPSRKLPTKIPTNAPSNFTKHSAQDGDTIFAIFLGATAVAHQVATPENDEISAKEGGLKKMVLLSARRVSGKRIFYEFQDLAIFQ